MHAATTTDCRYFPRKVWTISKKLWVRCPSSSYRSSLTRHSFVDTVHGPGGEGSIWTDNRFTNKFAAMPSLHFGYSLLIGLTIATIPLSDAHRSTTHFALPFFNQSHPKLAPRITMPSWRRMTCLMVGFFYPALILLAIIVTANHFILDAAAGSVVCGVAWWGNDVLLNLLAWEDWFLWVVRIHKPQAVIVNIEEDNHGSWVKGVLRE
jgi:PAP2 superfamily